MSTITEKKKISASDACPAPATARVWEAMAKRETWIVQDDAFLRKARMLVDSMAKGELNGDGDALLNDLVHFSAAISCRLYGRLLTQLGRGSPDLARALLGRLSGTFGAGSFPWDLARRRLVFLRALRHREPAQDLRDAPSSGRFPGPGGDVVSDAVSQGPGGLT